ncbi:peptidase M20 [Paenibacillus swuensis]|uniref:Peptidase M20 n=1 Tax=Paenibacillus swuensis TaxID=1178515 RepID=A0A172TK68_9BACL|nr:amidohydrolase [Paenibacillus swuensis]ANE47455.1 peptidase M20 [Paenibacillus swuensis]
MNYRDILNESYAEAVAWRRHLHMHPELSFHEENTADFVAAKLEEWGLEVRKGVGGGGVTGLLKGLNPGKTVALRADMDALPIQDEKESEYASTVPGVMHACGHDAHTSALLMVAKILSAHRSQFKGNVKFIFQHAEETTPGGAKFMIEDGVLHDVDYIYGVHLWTPLQAGHVYSVAGPMMAAADEFVIQLQGKGGHGGLPHETIDTVMIGSQVVVNLQTIVSRTLNPLYPAVVSVGSFQAGNTFNIIAEKCTLKGTVRTFDEESRQTAKSKVEDLTRQTSEMHGAQSNIRYILGYPPVVNDHLETERFFAVAHSLYGTEHVHPMPLLMAGEDFAYYLEQVPGCFMIVGAGNGETRTSYPHHHPKFDLEERAMLQSAELLLHMAVNALSE